MSLKGRESEYEGQRTRIPSSRPERDRTLHELIHHIKSSEAPHFLHHADGKVTG